MISDFDKKYNRVSKLYKSKWTSLKKINGWKHYEVANIDKKNKKIELFSICDKENRVIVDKEDLKNKNLWRRGWDSKTDIDDELSLMDQLINGTISRTKATRIVRQISRRKAEKRMLDKFNGKNILP